MKDPLGDHGQRQIALPTRAGGQQQGQAQPVHSAEDGLDVALRQAALDRKGFGGGDELLASQRTLDETDKIGQQVGDVAEGFMLDLGADAVGAAQQVGLEFLALVVQVGLEFLALVVDAWWWPHGRCQILTANLTMGRQRG